MPEKPNGKLTYRDRCYIEDGIRIGLSFRFMAKHLGVAPSTVTKEVKRNRTQESLGHLYQTTKNVCKKKDSCKVLDLCRKGCLIYCARCKQGLCNRLCQDFEEAMCPKLEKPPFVCNECPGRFGSGCEYGYRFYDAKMADETAKRRKTESRRGIDCTKEELVAAVELVKPLLKKGQSLDHIWATHGEELPCSARTFYRYINEGCLDIANLELPKKVSIKPRKHSEPSVPRLELKGRAYEDFQKLSMEEQMSAVEMDCVEGRRCDKKTILTLLFRRYSFQIMMLLPEKSQHEVAHALDLIEGLCGKDFSRHFGIVLTDRGSEFLDYERIETSKNGKPAARSTTATP
ncbi:helix-turn-helix domain-containing protein [Eggerthella lenta]|uniref:helix-turn-helix domain-containing protein n=1 Tax=Eggerthella lenta TaxID=84112 RepID=UPI001F36E133|nr:helix-turn-helix domain-containing protein [Eggerthella lenta]GKG83410.1 hypothetical protein CE91St34_06710 [Eggerthella lenta]GKG87401.1 hypothetical protein CE91St35_15550 [Eggerthella lenta]